MPRTLAAGLRLAGLIVLAAPAAAGAAATSYSPRRGPAPVLSAASAVRVPALGAGLRLSAPSLSLSPGASLSPVPALKPGVAAPSLAPLPPLAAPAPISGPAAPESPALPAVQKMDPAQAGLALWSRLARLFDGSKTRAPADDFAPYLKSAPELPLPPLARSSAWQPLRPPGSEKGSAFFHEEKSETIGEGQSVLLRKDTSAPGPWKRPGTAGATRTWEPPVGSRDAAGYGKDLYWIDPHGRLVLYSPEKDEAVAYSSHEGPVTRFAVAGPNRVFVLAAGKLQRWDLDLLYARAYPKQPQDAGAINLMVLGEDSEFSDTMTFHLPGRRIKSSGGGIIVETGALEAAPLVPTGKGLYLRPEDGGTRAWRRLPASREAADFGSIPFQVLALTPDPSMETLYAVVPEGLVVWEVRGGRYRLIPMEGLAGPEVRPSVHVSGDAVFLGAGQRLHEFRRSELADLFAPDTTVRAWSEQNPMSVRDGALRIGDFSFPIAKKSRAARPWYKRAFDRMLGRTAPAQVLDLGISDKDWKALNLPTNKKLIYDTLKGFTLSQHVLYIGETGGGKTWIADKIAKLTGSELWMVSMNEYTRNKDLIARETFGEEGKNKTGLTASTVLRWMQEGGVLLLDEMHKPLEGIAVLNNILQNGEYRLPDGRVVKYDKKKSWVIGTMNPVKPPYKGEPPSGELSSRFGMTLQVKYLPPDEEEALLKVFHPEVPAELLAKLVDAANRLRRLYPERLPLPIAPRTLMHIAEHLARYPGEDPADVFHKTYNPASIVEDPAIDKAIAQVLDTLFPSDP